MSYGSVQFNIFKPYDSSTVPYVTIRCLVL